MSYTGERGVQVSWIVGWGGGASSSDMIDKVVKIVNDPSEKTSYDELDASRRVVCCHTTYSGPSPCDTPSKYHVHN